MRKLLLGLLMGSAAFAPAQAQRKAPMPEDAAVDGAVREPAPDTPRPERAERREAREERRAERLEVREDAQPQAGATVDRPRRDRDGLPNRRDADDGVPDRRERRRDGDGMRGARPDRMVERPAAQVFPPRRDREPDPDRAERRDDRREARRDHRDGRLERRDDGRDWRDDRREARRDHRDDRRDRRDDRQDWRFDRRDDGWAGRGRAGIYGGGLVWNRGWRDDLRYDWTEYRRYNRDAFRLPRYYAPDGYGYQYRRFGVGAGLSRPFYERDYWIDDPFFYRLPPAYGPYRWVRYYGDALLVDLRTGRVVDVVYDIFY